MATHHSRLAWEIPWTEEPAGCKTLESEELDTTWRLNNNNNNDGEGVPGSGFYTGRAGRNFTAHGTDRERKVSSFHPRSACGDSIEHKGESGRRKTELFTNCGETFLLS